MKGVYTCFSSLYDEYFRLISDNFVIGAPLVLSLGSQVHDVGLVQTQASDDVLEVSGGGGDHSVVDDGTGIRGGRVLRHGEPEIDAPYAWGYVGELKKRKKTTKKT